MLLAMGSLTMCLYNQAKSIHLQENISDLARCQSHIVDILQEHEVAIHVLQHNVNTIHDSFSQITNIIKIIKESFNFINP